MVLPWPFIPKPLHHPRRTLIAVFVAWKSLLLVIAACSPGPGYDTSTTLAQPYDGSPDQPLTVSVLRLLSTKLTRWDAIFFTRIASRGYLYEQEWAFGWGLTRLIKFFASDLKAIGFREYEFLESFVGIILSHAAHGLSVIALYSLARAVFHGAQSEVFAFVTACLHVFSPAGLFLSAPFGESTFALLSFSGYLLYVRSFNFKGQITAYQDVMMATSGFMLGFATTVRTNGLLNGLLFLEEAVRIICLVGTVPAVLALRRLIATGIGGLCIAVGFLVPQFIAYQEFCGNSPQDHHSQRVWCTATLPSVYPFVQSYYWNVGFLRYWTLSNIPLFVLALPMLTIILKSSLWVMQMRVSKNSPPRFFKATTTPLGKTEGQLLRSLAAPQILLGILALTSYHVQIITRISSGYCVWYFWLAYSVISSANGTLRPETDKLNRWKLNGSNEIVMYMVLYAAIQAALFSSFLPPA